MLVVFHVSVSRIRWLSNVLGRPERLLVADFDLSGPVLLANKIKGRLDEWVAN